MHSEIDKLQDELLKSKKSAAEMLSAHDSELFANNSEYRSRAE